MTWTWGDPVAGEIVQSAEFLNEFAEACAERWPAYGLDWSAGDRIQWYDRWILDLQTWIETACEDFVVSHAEDGTPYDDASVHNHLATIPHWTWTTLKASMGITDWTRTLANGIVTTGRHASGDRRKAHLYDELVEALNRLTWTEESLTNYGPDAINGGYNYTAASWAGAKAAAESSFTTDNPSYASIGAYSSGKKNSGGAYTANIARGWFDCTLDVESDYDCEIDYAASVGKSHAVAWAVFDAHGDGVLEDDAGEYSFFRIGAAKGATVTLGNSGSTAYPTWFDYGDPLASYNGWKVRDGIVKMVVRWLYPHR